MCSLRFYVICLSGLLICYASHAEDAATVDVVATKSSVAVPHLAASDEPSNVEAVQLGTSDTAETDQQGHENTSARKARQFGFVPYRRPVPYFGGPVGYPVGYGGGGFGGGGFGGGGFQRTRVVTRTRVVNRFGGYGGGFYG